MLSFVSALGGPTDIKSGQELFGRSRVYLKKPRTLWVVLKHAKNSVGRSWEKKKTHASSLRGVVLVVRTLCRNLQLLASFLFFLAQRMEGARSGG